MPKIPPRKPPNESPSAIRDDYLYDTNANRLREPPKESLQISWITEMYGFVGVNRADWPEGSGYSEFIVNYLDFKSLRTSIGGVLDYVNQSCPNQRGHVVQLSVKVTEECEAVGPAKGKK